VHLEPIHLSKENSFSRIYEQLSHGRVSTATFEWILPDQQAFLIQQHGLHYWFEPPTHLTGQPSLHQAFGAK
jgi:hypothetical protein